MFWKARVIPDQMQDVDGNLFWLKLETEYISAGRITYLKF